MLPLRAIVEARAARLALSTPPALVARMLRGRRRVLRGVALDPIVQLSIELFRLSGQPEFHQVPVPRARVMSRAMAPIMDLAVPPVAHEEERTIAGPEGPLRMRIYREPGARERLPAWLYLHGGGYVVGTLEEYEPRMRALARATRMTILSLDYRLAPEHKFPAPIHDAMFVFEWMVEHAEELGINPRRIAVGGDSAGGNLSAVVCQLLRHREVRPGAQVLMYPVVDMSRRTRSREEYGNGFLLTTDMMSWFHGLYLTKREDVFDPRASPLLEPDLRGLPPALVITAGFDPLRDEGEAYAESLRAAGVHVEHELFPTLVHGFSMMSGVVQDARRLVPLCSGFLHRILQTKS